MAVGNESLEQMTARVRQHIAQSQLIQQDIREGLAIKQQLRIRQIVDQVVQESGLILSEEEYQVVLASIKP